MALFSSKGAYGVCAMYELLEVSNSKPLSIKEISSRIEASQNYLEQILNILKNQGFIKSVRGPKGGYLLAKNPNDILIKDIIVALEGEILITDIKPKNLIMEAFCKESHKKLDEIFNIPLIYLKTIRQKINNQIDYVI